MLARPASPPPTPNARRWLGLALTLLTPTLVGFGPLEPGSMSPAGVAMGGAGVASGAGTTALYTNPAGLAAHRAHNFELGYGRDGAHQRSTFFVQSADGQAPGFVQGGTAYAYETGTLADGRRRTGYEWRSGLALSGKSDIAHFMIGMSGRYVQFNTKAANGLAGYKTDGWTGDLGIAMALAGNVRVGFVWRNVLDIESIETPQRMAAGGALAFESFLLTGDVGWGVDTPGAVYRVGAALSVVSALQLRAGYRYSELGTVTQASPVGHVVTGGFGFRFGKWSADAAVAVPLSHAGDLTVIAALNYYLPAHR